MKSIKNQMIILCIVFLGICLFTGKENVYAANNRYIPEKFEVEKKGNSSVTLRWKPVSGVKGYVLYQYNTKSKKYERIKKVTDKKKKKITLRNLKGRKLKFRMRTYRNVSGRKKYGAYSPEVSVYMKKNKRNVSDIILKKAEYSIEKGSTIRLKYKLKPLKKLGSKKIVFSSTRPEIASVDSLGRVKAKAAGVTYIVLRSHNGKQKKIKITVTERVVKDNKSTLQVLTFHRIVSDTLKRNEFPGDEWVASVTDFEQQIKYLHDNNYRTLSMDEFYNWYTEKINYPEKTVVLTFDDGDYEIYYLVLPILKKYNMKATAFIVGSEIQEVSAKYEDTKERHHIGRDLIEKSRKEYPQLEYESHSYNLHYPGVAYSQSLDYFKIDFLSNRNNNFRYFAYPYGASSKNLIDAFKQSGYKLAFGFRNYKAAKRTDPWYNIPRVKINGQISFDDFKKILTKR